MLSGRAGWKVASSHRGKEGRRRKRKRRRRSVSGRGGEGSYVSHCCRGRWLHR
jgi:hypothetical protein